MIERYLGRIGSGVSRVTHRIDQSVFGNPGLLDKLTPKQQSQMDEWFKMRPRLGGRGIDIRWGDPQS